MSGQDTAFLLAILVLVAGSSLAAQMPDTMTVSDLAMRGLPEAADTAAARRALGRPAQVIRHREPNDDGVILVEWRYRGFTVSFDRGRRYLVDVTGPSLATKRQVTIGDSVDKVRRLYGTPRHEDGGHLLYAVSTSEMESQGITFFVTNGRVTRILVGQVMSVE